MERAQEISDHVLECLFHGKPSQSDMNKLKDEICIICRNGFLPEQNIAETKHCNHHFHLDCIYPWLEIRTSSPTCRTDVFTGEKHSGPTSSNVQSTNPGINNNRVNENIYEEEVSDLD